MGGLTGENLAGAVLPCYLAGQRVGAGSNTCYLGSTVSRFRWSAKVAPALPSSGEALPSYLASGATSRPRASDPMGCQDSQALFTAAARRGLGYSFTRRALGS